MAHLTVEQIWNYLDGELHSRQRQAVQTHIDQCTDCAHSVDKVRATASHIGEALSMRIPPQSPRLHADVVHELRELSRAPDGNGRRGRRARIATLSSAAAAVILAVGVGWTVLQHNPHNLPSGSQEGVAIRGTGTGENTAATNADNSSAANSGQLPLLATSVNQQLSGQASVTVDSVNGKPLTGVHVALIGDGRILSSTVTGSSGQTPQSDITLPVDAAVAPLSQSSDALLQSANLVVVAWKTGYQPIVSYDVRVFEGGTSTFNQSLVMDNQSSSTRTLKLAGYGFDNGYYSNYHVLTGSSFTDWAKTAAVQGLPDIKVGEKQAATGSDAAEGSLTVRVVDQSGKPVTGAAVRVVAGISVTRTATTNAQGYAGSLQTPGMDDWRFAGPWNVDGPPRIATVVVWKDGYASAVGFFQPVRMGRDRAVTVTLSSYAWRTAHGWDNNMDAASGIPGTKMPNAVDAERFLQWASGQSY